MKKSTERRMNLVVGAVLAVQVAGVCFILVYNAVHKYRYHRDLLATHDLRLEYEGPSGVELQGPHAYLRKDEVVISGCLNRTGSGSGSVASQVDVSVLSTTAAVLDQTSIRDFSRCTRGGVHFSEKLKVVPPAGSVLNLKAFADQGDSPAEGAASAGPGK
jgi:hypothetical protein